MGAIATGLARAGIAAFDPTGLINLTATSGDALIGAVGGREGVKDVMKDALRHAEDDAAEIAVALGLGALALAGIGYVAWRALK